MKFRFSLNVSLFCSTLALLMLYASYWQYTRYIAKLAYIRELDRRLEMPITPLPELLAKETDWSKIVHRRVILKGSWDYDHEIVLRNRKLGVIAGVHVITPLLIEGIPERRILISRGFLPLSVSEKNNRIKFRNGPSDSFVALIKESNPAKLFAPEDPESGIDKPWIDAWLRVDIEKISKQLPYPLEPYYLEMISKDVNNFDSNKLIQQKSERDQILFLPGAGARLSSMETDIKEENYPVPVFDTIVPAGRHYSYIFEWGIMAFGVALTGLLLQFRQPKLNN